MKVSLIVAVAENQVIGVNNDLPWNLPDDMRFFVQTTKGHHILCGRKNLESFGRPLPNRVNLILTRDKNFSFEGVTIVHDIDEAFSIAELAGEEELMVIGGGEIYRQTIDRADTIYLTRVHTTVKGETTFPVLDDKNWKETKNVFHPKDERHEFDFTFYTYERVV